MRVLNVENLENKVHPLSWAAASQSEEKHQPLLVVDPIIAVFIHNYNQAAENDLGQIEVTF